MWGTGLTAGHSAVPPSVTRTDSILICQSNSTGVNSVRGESIFPLDENPIWTTCCRSTGQRNTDFLGQHSGRAERRYWMWQDDGLAPRLWYSERLSLVGVMGQARSSYVVQLTASGRYDKSVGDHLEDL